MSPLPSFVFRGSAHHLKQSTMLYLITEHSKLIQEPNSGPEILDVSDIQPDMVVTMLTPSLEEKGLGICAELTQAYPEEKDLPPSDDISAMQNNLLTSDSNSTNLKEGTYRHNADTSLIVEQKVKKEK